MKRSTRIIAAIIALLFLLGVIFMVVITMSYAMTRSERSETVYITTDPDGTTKSMLSSVYITNPGKLDTVRDASTLTNIENTLASEPPKAENGGYVFLAKGEDVAYQGTAGGELPVQFSVAYTLNGSPVSASALGGVTGRIGITVKFINNSLVATVVNGQSMQLYTPFTAISMITLPENAQNITCENGKVASEAGSPTVAAILFPGLAYNLDAEATGRLSDKFHMEADVVDFDFKGIRAVIMTGLVEADDLKDTEDLTDLMNGIDDMSTAGDELSDGTSKLYRGVRDLNDGLYEYYDGVKELDSGMWEAIDGSGETISGMSELASGISGLKKGSGDLSASLDGISIPGGSMDSAALQQQLAALGLSPEQMAGVVSIVQQTASAASAQTASAIVSGVKGGLSQLQSGAAELEAGASKLGGGMRQVHNGFIELGKGMSTLSSEGHKLLDGAEELVSGVRKLRNGVKELNEEGLQELAEETGSMRVALDRKDAVVSLGEVYQTFSGLSKGMHGTVQFVFETEGIFEPKPLVQTPSSLEEGVQVAEQPQDLGFFESMWAWIRQLFGG